jgi:hypothetical protein
MTLIVVSGAIANKLHQGGEAWVRLSYLLGLRQLGFEVHFLEQISPQTCVDVNGAVTPFEQSLNREYFDTVMAAFGFSTCSTLIPTDEHGNAMITPELIGLADSSAAILNISGHLALEPLLHRFRNKVFIDIDPGYTQYWHASGTDGARLANHDWYFTIGENIGSPDCPIPTCGLKWHATRPPVVLDYWPVSVTSPPVRFTTIANWRGSYGVVQFGNRPFGLKAHEFRKVFELPERVNARFEIALNIHPTDHRDKTALLAHDWEISDPLTVAATPVSFLQYVQHSGGEFSVAQGIYVTTNSGWFSDRTVRYLACGKPALVQDTGFSQSLPTRKGLISFTTLDDAVHGVKSIMGDYASHCAAARDIAEEYFDSNKVLTQILVDVGITS